MKNLLGLAAAAVVLFSLSAGLSLWLNQTRQAAEPTKKDEDKGPKRVIDKEPETDKAPGKGPAKTDTPPLPDPGIKLGDLEERLRRRESQVELVARDLNAERQALDDLYRQVNAATKAAAARAAEAEDKAAVVPAKGTAPSAADPDPGADKKQLAQLSRVYAAMSPEAAAPIFRQMADGGGLDRAAQIIAGMPDRNAAQLLDRISQGDAGLATQITDRILRLRRTTPAGGAKTP
jgi:flagellar motility protein MotE (MotC chaperone)